MDNPVLPRGFPDIIFRNKMSNEAGERERWRDEEKEKNGINQRVFYLPGTIWRWKGGSHLMMIAFVGIF